MGGIAQWKLFALATGLCFGVTPYTIFTIIPIVGRMKELANKGKGDGQGAKSMTPSEEEEVKTLITKWTALNYFRSLFLLTGSVCGLCAIIR